MSLSFVLGMAVALAVYLLWRVHPEQLQKLFSAMALIVCPPFILALATGPTSDFDLAVFLTAGAIVFANACLYAGAAAGLYSVFTVVAKRRRS